MTIPPDEQFSFFILITCVSKHDTVSSNVLRIYVLVTSRSQKIDEACNRTCIWIIFSLIAVFFGWLLILLYDSYD